MPDEWRFAANEPAGVDFDWSVITLRDLDASCDFGSYDGTKEIIAIDDGYRESKESWLTLLRDLRARGMQAPVLAVGDGALGFWGALNEVFPATLEQRCWFNKLGNVLDKMPKSVHPKAKSAPHEIMNAPTREKALKGVKTFTADFGAKYPRAVECLTKDLGALLSFFDFQDSKARHSLSRPM